MMDKIDTSTLGPIKVDPNKMGTRAKMVRDALEGIAMRPECTIKNIGHSTSWRALLQTKRSISLEGCSNEQEETPERPGPVRLHAT